MPLFLPPPDPAHDAIAWLWKDARVPAFSRPAVAVVDRHIWLAGDKVLVRPGAQPRALPQAMKVIPVVHVEIDALRPPASLRQAAPGIVDAMRAAGRADRVSAYSFSSSTPVWWKNIQTKLTRASNLVVWQIDAAESQALAKLAERSMQLQVTVQDGTVWMSTALGSVEITPRRLTQGN